MGWVKIDDAFFRHPKVTDLSPASKLLFLAGLCMAAEQLSDGELTTGAARAVAGMIGVPYTAHKPLVTAGLWHQSKEGFVIHDYLDYQRSADQERQRRVDTSRRMQQMRARNRWQSDAGCDAVTDAPGDAVGDEGCDGVCEHAPVPLGVKGFTDSSSFEADPKSSAAPRVTHDGDENALAADDFVIGALTILADRRVAARNPDNPAAYRAALMPGLRKDHAATLAGASDLTFSSAEQLAKFLEPNDQVRAGPPERILAGQSSRPEPSAVMASVRDVEACRIEHERAAAACGQCDNGWVTTGGLVARCDHATADVAP